MLRLRLVVPRGGRLSALRAGDVDNILLGRVRVADERRGLLPHSIAKKQMHLRAFMRWLDERHIFDVKREDIETFLDARAIGPKTRHCWLSHLRVFAVYTKLDPSRGREAVRGLGIEGDVA